MSLSTNAYINPYPSFPEGPRYFNQDVFLIYRDVNGNEEQVLEYTREVCNDPECHCVGSWGYVYQKHIDNEIKRLEQDGYVYAGLKYVAI